MSSKADVCLFLEGTYPYYTGGVSTWTHDLITAQKELNFHLVSLMPPGVPLKMRYELPPNVVGLTNLFLQRLPEGKSRFSKKEKKTLFSNLERPLLNLLFRPELKELAAIREAFDKMEGELGTALLLDSFEAWEMLVRIYLETVGGSSFLNFFWSFRTLLGGLYSIMLAPLPEAKIYHTLCTGFAGLFLARAFVETKRPCLVTEHGIYTNERRIEIASAKWLEDKKAMNLSIRVNKFEKDLKDFWIDSFCAYSKLCYEASEKIITLYEGNKSLQRADGAAPEKLKVIPNGIDYERYGPIERVPDHPPTVALIGRVVPIKDIKTFIRAAAMLKERVPGLRVWVMGPTDEDRDYYEECRAIVKKGGVEESLSFLGKVCLEEYLGDVDVIALTSISESQPLVILEAGASGIPAVATDVGSCRELIYGRENETEKFGAGGAVCPLAHPEKVAEELLKLLTDKRHYQSCSEAIRKRVERYYQKKDQQRAYRLLYRELMETAGAV